ncbi:putidacin L1 family lectin-like bacteriocin [Pseudomonas putida]|uniref:putidacin L1 family lectin-like bacteriocin n=1 Tax=Pseudomonas putida TaxID=303 RepID=UPI002366E67A|nr:putidacin L1 family lectin-like bacteriocin [Pseudomonas putida]MDD2046121.1 putidacin L1 family lectin-like bacteriocin [Pseudomonas putida]
MARTRTLFQNSGSAVLPPYQELRIGQYLQSPNGRYRLVLQEDSNLALYDGNVAVWVADGNTPYSSTLAYKGSGPTALYVQYGAFLDDPTRGRKWITTPTDFTDNDQWNRVHLVLQNDGNLVEVDYRPLWKSNSSAAMQLNKNNEIIPPGTFLEPGRLYGKGNARLVFQGDGNLVLYGPNNSVLWATYTQGKGATKAVLQGDGNLVIYNDNGKALWNSRTAQQEGAFIQIQDDSFIIMRHNPVWARFGYKPSIKPKHVFNWSKEEWPTRDEIVTTF